MNHHPPKYFSFPLYPHFILHAPYALSNISVYYGEYEKGEHNKNADKVKSEGDCEYSVECE